MQGFYEFRDMDNVSRLPETLLRTVDFPINQASQLTPLPFKIKDFVVPNLHQRVAEGWMCCVGKRVRHMASRGMHEIPG